MPVFAVALIALSLQPAWAHIDPTGSTGNGITIEITAYRHNGVCSNNGSTCDPVLGNAGCPGATCLKVPVIGAAGGFVTPCEQIYYEVTLRKAPSPNGAFEGGTWSLQTPDQIGTQLSHPLGTVPCIGGTTNDPNAPGGRGQCLGSPDHITSALVPYTIRAADSNDPDGIVALTTLVSFFAHISTNDTGGNFAGLGLPLTKQACDDNLVCAPETCDENAVGVCSGGSDVGDHCTTNADCSDGATCDLTRTGGCTKDVVPPCTDSGCVDRECDPNGTTEGNCDLVTNAPSCAALGDRCNQYTCDDSGTVYRPNCDTHQSADACADPCFTCNPGAAGSTFDPNCETPTNLPQCVSNPICRITGGGIVCQGEGQCCNSTTGACAANNGSDTNSVTCTTDAECTTAFGNTFPTCTFCTTDPTTGADIEKATFGGQVGAPFVTPGCHDNANCVQGNWTHQRHKKHGSLHGPDFYNMVCRCDQGDGTTTDGVCGDRSNGPEPPAAPANIACFTGTALWNPTAGRRTIPVAFRVEIEDRGEPGGGSNAGNLDDVYRIRIWFGSSASDAQTKAEAACCDFDIATVVNNIGFPNVLDGGNLIHGNLQIHKLTGNPNNTNFPDQCFVGQ